MAHILKMNKKICIIGVGPISDWHVRALKFADLDVVAAATRPGSTRLIPFAEKHGIKTTFPNWNSLLAKASQWDGLVIASHVSGTPEILAEGLKLNIPILVEKPSKNMKRSAA